MLWHLIQNQLDKKGWSQRKLSEKSHIPFSTLNKYKFCDVDPTFIKICKIADALGISLDDLRNKK